jgi:hypothetical protein
LFTKTKPTLQMEQQNVNSSGTWKTLAIFSLVLGILAFIFSFVPCLGMYAIFPGVIGLIMGGISLSMAGKVNAPKGMAIAGLVCALLGSGIAGWQYYKIKQIVEDPAVKKGLEDMKNTVDSIKNSIDTSATNIDTSTTAK